MRLTGKRELADLYGELEGVGFIPSISYIDLVRELKESRIYVCSLRVDIMIRQDYVLVIMFNDYPEAIYNIEFKRGNNNGR